MNNIEYSKIGNIAVTQLENIYSHEWDQLNRNIILMNKRLKVSIIVIFFLQEKVRGLNNLFIISFQIAEAESEKHANYAVKEKPRIRSGDITPSLTPSGRSASISDFGDSSFPHHKRRPSNPLHVLTSENKGNSY